MQVNHATISSRCRSSCEDSQVSQVTFQQPVQQQSRGRHYTRTSSSTNRNQFQIKQGILNSNSKRSYSVEANNKFKAPTQKWGGSDSLRKSNNSSQISMRNMGSGVSRKGNDSRRRSDDVNSSMSAYPGASLLPSQSIEPLNLSVLAERCSKSELSFF